MRHTCIIVSQVGEVALKWSHLLKKGHSNRSVACLLSAKNTLQWQRRHSRRHSRHFSYFQVLALTKAETVPKASSVCNFALYNSLTRQKEAFKPQAADGSVSMYVCGVTVYDYSHIGHARVYTCFDILYRYLKILNYKVKYVRNFTDIDDKIIKRSQEAGSSPEELSEKFINEFHTDMASLNCLPPTLEPRATEFIQASISDIECILKNEHGYESGGDVFFDISTFKSYGKLSGRKQKEKVRFTSDLKHNQNVKVEAAAVMKEDNRAGERVGVDSKKRNAADFVLWKAGREGEPQWESPWGPGRPGWHMECSAMIRSTLGPAIDIHGGGRDLMFPHHENEIAQAQAASDECECKQLHPGRGFVNFWLHNGFVNVDSEKMSKSLGNFFTIRDVVKLYHPLALRLFLISSHYRAPINYTQKGLEMASDRLFYIYQAIYDCHKALGNAGSSLAEASVAEKGGAAKMVAEMHSGLSDDLNTSPVLSALSEPLKRVNDLCHTKQGKKAQSRLEELGSLHAGFRTVLDVLGIWNEDPETILQDLKIAALRRAGISDGDVQAAIERRAAARKNKDFAAADREREVLASKGIQIMDSSEGTTWRPVVVENDS